MGPNHGSAHLLSVDGESYVPEGVFMTGIKLLNSLTSGEASQANKGRPTIQSAIESWIGEIALVGFQRPSMISRIFGERLSMASRVALLQYADHQSERAIREARPGCVTLGLMAVAIEDGRIDYRDSLCIVARLYHSATKLAINADQIFSDASRFARSAFLRGELGRFPHRDPSDRELSAFFLIESNGPDGFRYEQKLPL